MQKDLGHYRKSYNKGTLLEDSISDTPYVLFEKWFLEVDNHFEGIEVNAMTLSTISSDGYPKSRVVLLKKYNSEGFIFYTNYESNKGKSIIKHPKVCLSFYWEGAERQVIIKGKAEKIPSSVSDSYFKSRPRGSQLGAYVSKQSSVVKNRSEIENRLIELEEKFRGQSINRPEFWGGFIVRPIEIEFWQGRENRLHDRILYKLDGDLKWLIQRLSP
ncbi:MAG: pyridoxamine 5'-phosphate oxidase [Flavobacteriaceae bacterium]|nr:pyridoxamine 5'-phosphate oxidase [Flavobacteriaceae bacterium]|tara:strand:+ start:97936 stop:98583 length:648 start_codon:yes stop_codon:yes gene_type:complete